MTMLAFHAVPAVKAKYLDRVRAHRAADEIIQGTYWEGGKGCAVGCAIHGSDHGRYEVEMGIPVGLAKLEDAIFEGLPNRTAKDFPVRFLEAIPIGADLAMVEARFMHWLLTSPEIDLAGKSAAFVACDSARVAAIAAAWEVASAAAIGAAHDAAIAAAWQTMADGLIILLAEAPVPVAA